MCVEFNKWSWKSWETCPISKDSYSVYYVDKFILIYRASSRRRKCLTFYHLAILPICLIKSNIRNPIHSSTTSTHIIDRNILFCMPIKKIICSSVVSCLIYFSIYSVLSKYIENIVVKIELFNCYSKRESREDC